MKKKKFLKGLLIVLLSLIAIEVSLRAVECCYYFYYQNLKKLGHKVDSSAYRIICIGESTVIGMGATGIEHSFPAQLEILLKKRFPDKKIQVFNLGVGAITSAEIVLSLNKNLSYYRPHLVVLTVGENVKWVGSEKGKLIPAILCHLSQYKVIKLVEFFRVFFKKDIWIKKYKCEIWTDKARNRNEKAISYMMDTIKNYGARIIMCNYFIGWYNEDIKELAKKYDLIFCDNERIYKKFKESGRENEIIFEDNWHPNDQGYYLIAENIFKTIIEYKILK